MKKNILFVIDSLTIGGAEKSLVSLLNLIDPSIYEIDLLLFRKGGELERYLPKHINILPVPEYFQYTYKEKFNFIKNLIFFYFRVKTAFNLRLNKYKKHTLHSEQVVFKSIKKIISHALNDYEVAIAYSQGMPTYYVANKVKASKKIGWINTDYVNTLYDKELDFQSYKEINKIITVSQHTKESISKMREEYKNKVDLILDIIDPTIINKMADEHKVDEYVKSAVNILTVGRLVTAKSHDTAIEVARMLKAAGYKISWFVIGEGPERKRLQALINKYELNACFLLLGKKVNPYTYMKNCDLYVQTSTKEGFGLTVCEAKILKRPIVCANFSTAKEIINNNVDGLIVDNNVKSIYNGIIKYIDDIDFRNGIINELKSKDPYSSVNQLKKFYQIVQN